MSASSVATLLQGIAWCWSGEETTDVTARGAVRSQSYARLTFLADGVLQVESGVRPSGGQGPPLSQGQGSSHGSSGCWRVDNEQASLSYDGKTWIPIEVREVPGDPAQRRLRISSVEYVPCLPDLSWSIQPTGMTR